MYSTTRGCSDRCSLSRQGTTSSPFLGEQHNVPSSVRRPDRNRNLPLARSIRKNDLIRMRKQETENARPKKRWLVCNLFWILFHETIRQFKTQHDRTEKNKLYVHSLWLFVERNTYIILKIYCTMHKCYYKNF